MCSSEVYCDLNDVEIDISDRIPLSWEPPIIKESLYHGIQDGARFFCTSFLLNHCHDPSCQCAKMQHYLSPDPTEDIEVFVGFYGEGLREVLPGPSLGDVFSELNSWFSDHVCWRFGLPCLVL